ncbi:unnamed protein product [Allacma fusca]|uniref:Dynein heavy chain n=1 Tax=Allacma fusca TaxID=39272 RepID=A0A8J2Q1T5_9HEXA|nr:unnamed protein product [Allacma fusca]
MRKASFWVLSWLGSSTVKWMKKDQVCIEMFRLGFATIRSQITMLSSFADPFEVRVWNTSGLPKDSTSTENAVLVTRGRRWPLMIDPQDQANRWVKRMESEKQLKVLKLTDGTFMRTMENCVRLGTPCLLEEIGETLDPSLEPILQRQVFTQAGRTMIRLGDTNVDYDHNFRLYMTTKLANPHYLPEICIKVTIINFTVTMSGLEDQLLSEVVGIERPDLESQRSTLIASINSDKNQLISLETKILRLLFQSEGNILDDEELVEALNDSKKTSVEIVKRLKEAEETEIRISAAREKYRPVASRGSVLYFVVAQLTELDPMYQYSLKYFVQVFIQCIASTEKSEELDERLRILRKATTLATYTNISRGLFEKDKLVFSFMLCSDIMRNRDSISDAEWNFFLRGGVGVEQARTTKPSMAEWISSHQWNQLCDLEASFPIWEDVAIQALKDSMPISFGSFKFILFAGSSKGMARLGKSSESWDKKLSKFQKLLLIKCCAEEKLVPAITEFVRSELGQKFVESPSIDLPKIYNDLNKITPLVFVLSVGSDPMAAFYRFAGELEFHDRISTVSLGQGQGPVAENMIRNATSSGDWVFLQNCHLAASWMPSLEVVVKTLNENADEVADSFRLYLSSMPTRAFPVSVLQDSVKITNEPPKGIRANVRQAMVDLEKNFFEDNVLGSDWKRMIFGICFFHAVIQERKKFGPLGWNIKYEFNDSDRNCALSNLDMFCKEGRIPWDALEYITGQITYGGRITDNWDQRCLTTILKTYFAERTLTKHHKYSPSGIYYAPFYKHLKDYITYIDKLPIIDEPEIFGMHENANITFQQQESINLLNCILTVQPRQSAGKAASVKDEIAFEQAAQFEKKLPPIVDVDSGSPLLFELDKEGRLPSLSVFLKQEVDRFNKMLAVMKTSLEQLKKGILGLVVMSEDLEKMYQSFLNNQVPENWTRVSYGSLKSLASWYTDMLIRANFIERWFSGHAPISFWMSGFFFQQGFLTAVLQTYARRHGLPIDQLKFHYTIAPIIKEEKIKLDVIVEKSLVRPMDGVLVHGLFLEAARWDFERMCLADPKPGEMNPMMPVIHFLPVQNPDPVYNVYTAPLYKTSIRAGVLSTTGHSTNFIVSIQLPSKQPEDYWILKGSALLSQLTD